MLQDIIVVTDLGPGDGGKGGIVHALAHKLDASVIIKRGGAQGSHGMRTSGGEAFNFSQWGCATFEGVPSFLSEQMVISPVGLKNEADSLRKHGINDPFIMLSCDPNCICSTPFHKIASQLEELLRKDKPRGTIGSGVGQAYRMCNSLGDEATIRAFELTDYDTVHKKLKAQLRHYRSKYAQITQNDGLQNDTELIATNLSLLFDNDYLAYCEGLFCNIGQKLKLEELSDIIRNHDRNAIVECSHGVLTDAEVGLKPHTSAIRTLPTFTTEMLRQSGYDGKITNFAVRRAYEIRHGAGPIPTYDQDFTNRMLPGSHKETNRWQGIVRAGALDMNLFGYALDVSGLKYDGLCLTWFDQIIANDRSWPICTKYKTDAAPTESFTEYLKRAEPITESISIPKPISTPDLFELTKETLSNYFDIPLEMVSIGPTELDKIYSPNFTRRFTKNE
jgi:adenylosuccinate synthase